MNRKGFTLIEVLVVIVILGIILVIAVPSLLYVYNDSKLKSEEIFVDRLSDVIDSYIKLNSSGIVFIKENYSANKKNGDETTYSVDIYRGPIKVNNIITDNLLSENDYVNAGNKDVSCNKEAEIEVYRDSDYVYCYKVNKSSLGCLTDEYKGTIIGDYVIDTCVWSK